MKFKVGDTVRSIFYSDLWKIVYIDRDIYTLYHLKNIRTGNESTQYEEYLKAIDPKTLTMLEKIIYEV